MGSLVMAIGLDAEEINQRLSEEDVFGVLRWAGKHFQGRVAFASSLGLEDQVIVDALARKSIDIPVFTLDTGRLFPETYELIARTEQYYGIHFRIMFPEADEVERTVSEYGVNLFRKNVSLRKQCCLIRKLKPLKRALSGLSAWVTGIRREQAESRTEINLVEWDGGNGLIKINPLAYWSAEDVQAYIEKNNVPYNPLHDKGYPSIGCACCTRAVAAGENPRAGRWWWEEEEKKECGLHVCGNRLVRKSDNG